MPQPSNPEQPFDRRKVFKRWSRLVWLVSVSLIPSFGQAVNRTLSSRQIADCLKQAYPSINAINTDHSTLKNGKTLPLGQLVDVYSSHINVSPY